MKLEQIKNAVVIGLGVMGPGIVHTLALAGISVRGFDLAPKAADLCAKIVDTNLGTLVEAGHITQEQAKAAQALISYTTSLDEVLADAQLVVEAVSENRDIKRSVYAQVDQLAPADALIWSNTSTLNIFELMPERRQASSVIAHWFAPPHIIPLVEVVKGPQTSQETVDTSLALLEKMGRVTIVMEKYVPGFVINRLQRILGREVLFLLEEGYVSAEDLDKAVKASLAPRMMVLGLVQRYDFTGLELSARNLADESFFDPPVNPAPAPLVDRIKEGHTGAKAGQGFFDYRDRDYQELLRDRDRALLKVMDGVRFCIEKGRLF